MLKSITISISGASEGGGTASSTTNCSSSSSSSSDSLLPSMMTGAEGLALDSLKDVQTGWREMWQPDNTFIKKYNCGLVRPAPLLVLCEFIQHVHCLWFNNMSSASSLLLAGTKHIFTKKGGLHPCQYKWVCVVKSPLSWGHVSATFLSLDSRRCWASTAGPWYSPGVGWRDYACNLNKLLN